MKCQSVCSPQNLQLCLISLMFPVSRLQYRALSPLHLKVLAWKQEDTPAASGLLDELPAIDDCFKHDRLEDIYEALRQRGDAWARETLQNLSK